MVPRSAITMNVAIQNSPRVGVSVFHRIPNHRAMRFEPSANPVSAASAMNTQNAVTMKLSKKSTRRAVPSKTFARFGRSALRKEIRNAKNAVAIAKSTNVMAITTADPKAVAMRSLKSGPPEGVSALLGIPGSDVRGQRPPEAHSAGCVRPGAMSQGASRHRRHALKRTIRAFRCAPRCASLQSC